MPSKYLGTLVYEVVCCFFVAYYEKRSARKEYNSE